MTTVTIKRVSLDECGDGEAPGFYCGLAVYEDDEFSEWADDTVGPFADVGSAIQDLLAMSREDRFKFFRSSNQIGEIRILLY